ncbi:MAG: AAA family ATPase, partial [Pseudonocardiaceae bacterium]
DTELDAAQRALARGDSAGARDSAATAVELARQPLLPGYVGEWLDARREQLRGSLITGLEVLARAAEPAAAVRHAAEALALEPFRESVYQLLIDAHLAAGNRAEALRAYQRCRDVLGTRRGPVAEDAAVLSAGAAAGLSPAGSGQPPLPAGPAGPERGRFVGRQVELDRLRVLVGSRTRLVLVMGEPGIGKTRLSARFGRGLHAEGSTVLFGRCGEKQVAPYQPFLEALRQLVIGSPPEQLRSMTGIWAPDLALILPELGDLPAGIAANPDTERFRLFEGVAAMLSATSAVVVVDDLQWADRSTLLLLRHIVRSAENVLVVATCRDGETDRTA